MMDRKIAIKNLAQVEEMVALGLKHTADQEVRITGLHGGDLARAQAVLRTLNESLRLHKEHRDRLRAELVGRDPMP
jgi:hypothetical protein